MRIAVGLLGLLTGTGLGGASFLYCKESPLWGFFGDFGVFGGRWVLVPGDGSLLQEGFTASGQSFAARMPKKRLQALGFWMTAGGLWA